MNEWIYAQHAYHSNNNIVIERNVSNKPQKNVKPLIMWIVVFNFDLKRGNFNTKLYFVIFMMPTIFYAAMKAKSLRADNGAVMNSNSTLIHSSLRMFGIKMLTAIRIDSHLLHFDDEFQVFLSMNGPGTLKSIENN